MSGREELVAAYLRLHPESAARLLESMAVEQANAVLNAVDVATAAPVVGYMLPTCAAQCIERQPPADGALLLERLGSRESVAVLRHLPIELREAVLSSLGPQWLMAFKLLLSYPTNTVGAWVEPRVLTLPDECTAGEARERIARSEHTAQARIYVLDRSRRLRGAVRGLALLQVRTARKSRRSSSRPTRCGRATCSPRRRSTASGSGTRKRPSSIARRNSSASFRTRTCAKRSGRSTTSRGRAATARSRRSPSSSRSAPAACGAASAT